MSEHTKGPWVNGYGEGVTGPTTPTQWPTCHETVAYNDWKDAGSDYDKYPAIMHTVISKDKETIAIIPLCGSNGKANARLIAAAPDLLDFARRAYYLVEKTAIVDEYLEALRIPLGDLMPTQIVDEALIAKATG